MMSEMTQYDIIILACIGAVVLIALRLVISGVLGTLKDNGKEQNNAD